MCLDAAEEYSCFISWHHLCTCHCLFFSVVFQSLFFLWLLESLRSQRLLGHCSATCNEDALETAREVWYLFLFIHVYSYTLSVCFLLSGKSCIPKLSRPLHFHLESGLQCPLQCSQKNTQKRLSLFLGWLHFLSLPACKFCSRLYSSR